jgi:hypothetical protein
MRQKHASHNLLKNKDTGIDYMEVYDPRLLAHVAH